MAATSSPAGPGQQDRIRGIDGLRGIAALMVLSFHVYTLTGFPPLDDWIIRPFISGGLFGVDLFFVLSGFVLFVPMVRRGGPGSGKAYAIRRLGRVAPAYYFALFIAVAFRPWVHIFPSNNSFFSTTGLAHVFFLQTPLLGQSRELGFGGVQQVWTLSHEMLFYATLFFIGSAFAKRPLVGLSLALAISVGWRVALARYVHDDKVMDHLSIQFPSYVLHFALGMLVAVLHVRTPAEVKQRFAKWAPWLLLAATVTVMVLITRTGMRALNGTEAHGEHHLRNLGIATCFAVVVLCVVNGPAWLSAMLEHRALHWLGEISYGVYLFHIFVIGFALWLWGGPPVPAVIATNQMFFAMLGWTLSMSCILAKLSYDYVEQPIRDAFRITGARLAAGRRATAIGERRERARKAAQAARAARTAR